MPDIEDQTEKRSSPVQSPASSTTTVAALYPETDLDKGIIGWDSQDDPSNPQNFSPKRKWMLLALMSSFTFISPLASSMFSPAISYVAADFRVTNETLLSFSVTIFLLGYTVCFPLHHQSLPTSKAIPILMTPGRPPLPRPP